MDAFKSKYPVTTILIGLVSALAVDAAASGQSVIQKLEESIQLVPQMLGVAGQIGALSAELAVLKASPVDVEAGAELLVVDLGLTSPKAVALMPAVFAVGEWAVAGVAPMQSLISALQA